MEWFFKIIGFIGSPSDGRAIVMAILGGIFFTQWLKFQLPQSWSSELHKRITRAIGTLLTSAICVAMWPPGDDALTMLTVSFVIGLASPTIYWCLMKWVYHKWPWLNDVMSARPDVKVQP